MTQNDKTLYFRKSPGNKTSPEVDPAALTRRLALRKQTKVVVRGLAPEGPPDVDGIFKPPPNNIRVSSHLPERSLVTRPTSEDSSLIAYVQVHWLPNRVRTNVLFLCAEMPHISYMVQGVV